LKKGDWLFNTVSVELEVLLAKVSHWHTLKISNRNVNSDQISVDTQYVIGFLSLRRQNTPRALGPRQRVLRLRRDGTLYAQEERNKGQYRGLAELSAVFNTHSHAVTRSPKSVLISARFIKNTIGRDYTKLVGCRQR
jgi:hypothetical protein